jgi:hypothetical protein
MIAFSKPGFNRPLSATVRKDLHAPVGSEIGDIQPEGQSDSRGGLLQSVSSIIPILFGN